MNLIQFLWLDFFIALLLGGFLLKSSKAENGIKTILQKFNGSELLDNTLINTPSLKELLELEKLARKKGSGIAFDSLIGNWRFESVYRQKSEKEDSITSSLLKLFSASLDLSRNQINNESFRFQIINKIKFGELSISFFGFGALKGTQPLLPFFFEKIEVKLGKITLFSRTLNIPEDQNQPFFALIAMGEESQWLAARGRGGGLALWVKNDSFI